MFNAEPMRKPDAMVDLICAAVREGRSVTKTCRDLSLSKIKFYAYIEARDDLRAKYAQAVASRNTKE